MIDLALILACCAGVAPQTVAAIIQTESAGQVLAIGANPPVSDFSQPVSVQGAAAMTKELMAQGRSVDMGLMQVNSRHLRRFDLEPQDLFDPCTNIRVGTTILIEFYGAAARRYGEHSNRTLTAALSAYNTGSFSRGIINGYVQKVQSNVVVGSLPGHRRSRRNQTNDLDRLAARSPIQIEFNVTPKSLKANKSTDTLTAKRAGTGATSRVSDGRD